MARLERREVDQRETSNWPNGREAPVRQRESRIRERRSREQRGSNEVRTSKASGGRPASYPAKEVSSESFHRPGEPGSRRCPTDRSCERHRESSCVGM
jgi:hypothetical protein